MERLDALTVRESGDKSYWTRIGVAFPAKQGGGWTVLLDAMPAPVDGQYKIILREPLPRDDDRRAPPGRAVTDEQRTHEHGPKGGGDIDDEIPFSPLRDMP